MTVVDVGDAFELVFTTAPGALVRRSWYDPDQALVGDELEQVVENPPGSGKFPDVFQADRAGWWTAQVTVSGAAVAVEEHQVWARPVPAVRPLAALGHITEQFGTLTAAQEGLTKSLLRAGSALIRSQFPGIDAQILAGQLDAEVVALALTNMILRVLRNPQGLRGQTVGPFSFTYDTTVAAGALIIGPGEVGMLSPAAASVTAAAMAFGTTRIKAGMAPPVTRVTEYPRGW